MSVSGGPLGGLSGLSVRVRSTVCEPASVRYAACTGPVLEASAEEGNCVSQSQEQDDVDLAGQLRWNEFEGGFWSLRVSPPHPEWGGNVELPGWTPPAGARDGQALRVRARHLPASFGFTMSGPRFEVLEATLGD